VPFFLKDLLVSFSKIVLISKRIGIKKALMVIKEFLKKQQKQAIKYLLLN